MQGTAEVVNESHKEGRKTTGGEGKKESGAKDEGELMRERRTVEQDRIRVFE